MDTPQTKRPRTVIIGVDGMAHWLVRHLIDAGKLPHLAALARRGAFVHLQSTMPYHSAAAWTSITTGTNPGKHGLIDFVQHQPHVMCNKLVSSVDVRVQRLYDYAGTRGRSCCVANVPVTYPPRPVPGLLMTGLLTPAEAEVFTHPPQASAELRQAAGEPHFAAGRAFSRARKQEYVDALLEGVDYHGRLYLHMLRERRADFHLLVFMDCDHATHKLWGPLDPDSATLGTERGPFEQGFIDVLQRTDEWVGRIVEELDPEDTVMVLSDHGCAPLRGTVNINRWLIQQGLLVPRRSLRGTLKRTIARLDLVSRGYRVLARLGLGRLIYLFPRRFRSAAVGSFQSLERDVDWSRTRAYAMGAHGKIYVNLKGREPAGIVEPGREYEDLRRRIVAELGDLRDPDGRPLADEIYLREDVYDGPCAADMPDIVFGMADSGMLMSQKFGMGGSGLFDRDPSGSTGMHDRHAFLLVAGPGVVPGAQARDAQLTDIAPTALFAMRCPVPGYMDGRVLTELFDPAFLQAHPPETDLDATPDGAPRQAAEEAETDSVKERLAGLGYM